MDVETEKEHETVIMVCANIHAKGGNVYPYQAVSRV